MWRMVRDCIEGAHAVKQRRTLYLPKPNPDDNSPANEKRYEAYLRRAVFYGITSRTLVGFVGQVFEKDPQFAAPASLDALKTDMDGQGSTIIQFTKKLFTEVMSTGRAGIMADFPDTGATVTKADLESKRIHPFFRFYKAEEIINWRVALQNSVKYLSLVVLREESEEPDGEFGSTCLEQFRSLYCDGTTVSYKLWQRMPNGEAYTVIASGTMKDSTGAPLTRIPFTFVGAADNTENIGPVPMLDMAQLNISLYCNTADEEDSGFLVGQPTPVFAGLTKEWVTDVLKGEVRFGSRSAVFLPEGASAELLQADGNTIIGIIIDRKIKQMTALGAQLVQETKVQKTATEASIDSSADKSVLSSVVHNVNAALQWMLRVAYNYLEAFDTPPDEKVLNIELNTDFAMSRMDPQERAELIAEWQAGAIDYEEVRWNLKRSGVAFKDDQEVKDGVNEEMTYFNRDLLAAQNDPANQSKDNPGDSTK